ncbi:MAG: hypothetical protein ACLTA5_04325 [Anaerococcus obesiensis]
MYNEINARRRNGKTKINDILTYDFYSSLEISNDEKYLAFLKTNADLDENKYNSYLYLFDIEKIKNIKFLTIKILESLFLMKMII